MPIPQLEKKRGAKSLSSNEPKLSRREKRALFRERQGKEKKSALQDSESTRRTSKHHTHTRETNTSVSESTTDRKRKRHGDKSREKGKEEKGELKKNGKRRFFTRKKIIKLFLILIIAGIGLGAAAIAGAYAWVSKDLADISDLDKRAIEQSTKIYASDGQTLLYEIGDNKRSDVTLDKIDPEIQWATLALEDKRFYEHGGLDVIGLARAALTWRNLSTAQGASTLTQQFVKNAILSEERTVTRKAKEAILSYRLEQKYSKDQILEMYLNEVYYGPNYQGIEAGSQAYFHKSAQDVTLSEAAILASLPKNPVVYPRDPERLKIRRDYALDVMVELGKITQEQADAAKQEPINLAEQVSEIKAAHFVFYVSDYLQEKYGQNVVSKGGLKVITTLDWDKQQKGEAAIRDNIGRVEEYGGDNAALVSLDAHTGKILAMVGSRDFWDKEHDGEVNVATAPNQQPGSSFKPLVYLTAFSKGFTPDTKLYDLITTFPLESGPYTPKNFDASAQHGPVTLRYALSQSLNIPAVKLAYLVGVSEIINTAEKFGYTTFTNRDQYGLSIALGAGDVSLLEHTSAFATLAREGEYHKPAAVLSVTNRDGTVLEEWKDSPQNVFDQQAVRTLTSVLSDSGARGSVFRGLNLSDRTVAAKTGTSNEFRDAWTMGYTPSVATGVWTGRNDNAPMEYLADGIIIAAPIWHQYMESVLAGTPVETFLPAEYHAANSALAGNLDTTKEYAVDSQTGEIIPDECVSTYPQEYVEKKEFKETHEILHYITKENPTGPVPSNPSTDPMYDDWEGPVQAWAKSGGREKEYISDATPKASCDVRSDNQDPKASITSLDSGQTYTAKTFRLLATIEAGKNRKVNTVQFLLDGRTIETKSGLTITSAAPVESFNMDGAIKAGKHAITVKATDDRGNTAETTVTIVYEDEQKKADPEPEPEPTPKPKPNSNSNQNANDNSNVNGGGNSNTNNNNNTNN